RWFDTSVRIQETVMEAKTLYPNVDFYTASVYSALGLPPDLYTPLFAASRMAGWTAHIREQYADNRLIRPDSEYVGAAPRPSPPASGLAGPAPPPLEAAGAPRVAPGVRPERGGAGGRRPRRPRGRWR